MLRGRIQLRARVSDLEDINRLILAELWKISQFMITDTTIKGKYMLRACNVNQRSKYSDFDILVERITSIGDTIAKVKMK